MRKKRERDHRDIYDDLSMQLGDIHVIADQLGNGSDDAFQGDQVNAAGYCLTRMIEEAQKLSEEHLRLWQGGAS